MSQELENPSDLGNARRFVAQHGHRVRFVPAWGRWLVFHEGRWMKDETGLIHRLVRETVANIYAEAAETEDNAERTRIAKHAIASEGAARLRAIEELARVEPGIPAIPDDLDGHPFLVNVRNGTVDLTTATFRCHNPAELLTRMMPVEFQAGAGCPRWLGFINEVMGERVELVAFVQKMVGYMLTGSTSEQCLFFLYGLGNNGKSLFLAVLLALFGDYGLKTSFSTFVLQANEGIRNDLARLAGVRLIVASETRQGQRLDESLVKDFTGGDRISARFLRQEFFDYTPVGKIMLAGNHRPEITGTDLGIWRRQRLVPFTVTFSTDTEEIAAGARAAADYEKLKSELLTELPGIFVWAVEGCQRWRAEGLKPPVEVLTATEDYRAEMNPLEPFIEAQCIRGVHEVAAASDLFDAYREWAEAAGEKRLTQTAFGRKLTDMGIRADKNGTGGTKRRIGLRLRTVRDGLGQFSPISESMNHHRRNIGEPSATVLPFEIDDPAGEEREAIQREGVA